MAKDTKEPPSFYRVEDSLYALTRKTTTESGCKSRRDILIDIAEGSQLKTHKKNK